MTTALSTLMKAIGPTSVIGTPTGIALRSCVADSRQVAPGDLFCCVPGATFDGHDFARVAVEAGAVALLVDHPLALDVPQLVVPSGALRHAMAVAAHLIAQYPADALTTCGVTGTNGKTTVTQMLGAPSECERQLPGLTRPDEMADFEPGARLDEVMTKTFKRTFG